MVEDDHARDDESGDRRGDERDDDHGEDQKSDDVSDNEGWDDQGRDEQSGDKERKSGRDLYGHESVRLRDPRPAECFESAIVDFLALTSNSTS